MCAILGTFAFRFKVNPMADQPNRTTIAAPAEFIEACKTICKPNNLNIAEYLMALLDTVNTDQKLADRVLKLAIERRTTAKQLKTQARREQRELNRALLKQVKQMSNDELKALLAKHTVKGRAKPQTKAELKTE